MTETQTGWRSRIVGQGVEAPDQLLANPNNWRIHPQHQQKALGGILDNIGWVQDVIVNKTTGYVVDGHLRVALAISKGEATVPVSYVELSESEENLVLAALDPVGTLAVADLDALDKLRLGDRSGELAASYAGGGGLPSPAGAGGRRAPTGSQGDAGGDYDDDEFNLACPECGHEFVVNLSDPS
jgi:hypothetical protein